MGELINGNEKISKFKEIISEATEFVYIGTTWMTPDIAELIVNICVASKKLVILGDTQPYNIESYKILKAQNFEVFIDKDGHYKYLLTESRFITGSQNFTGKGFFDQFNCFEVRSIIEEPKEYGYYLKFHIERLANSQPYDSIYEVKKVKNNNKVLNTEWNKIFP
jgi:hypothetical protein